MKAKNNLQKTNKWVVLVIVALVFCLSFAIAIGTDFGSGPDEAMKYDLSEFIMNNLALPDGREESLRHSLWGISYAFSPYLSYMLAGVVMRGALDLFSADSSMLLVASRIVSAISIALYAFFCIKISDQLFKKKIHRYLFIGLAVFLPQIIYIGGYMNNDSMALLAASVIFYAWILGIKNDWSYKSCILLGIGIGICSLSYYNAYGYILCSVILFLWDTIRKRYSWKDVLKKGAVISGIALLIGGWFFVRNMIIYDGDVLGLSTESATAELYAVDQFKPSQRLTPLAKGESVTSLFTVYNWPVMTYRSFIGSFGGAGVTIPAFAYLIYTVFYLSGFIGILYVLINRRAQKIKSLPCSTSLDEADNLDKKSKKALIITSIIAMIVPLILSIYYSYASDYQPQGRYIISSVIPLMWFISIGIANLIDSIIKSEQVKKVVLWSIIGVLILAPIYFTFAIIIPNL